MLPSLTKLIHLIRRQDTSSALGDAKGNNIALFSKSPASSEAEKKPSTITNTATVKAFITELNKNNSGIIDSLCKLILAIIQYDPISTNENTTPVTIMSNEFLDLITDTITTLESNFVECILSDATTSATQKLMVSATVLFHISVFKTYQNLPLSARLLHELMNI